MVEKNTTEYKEEKGSWGTEEGRAHCYLLVGHGRPHE